MTIWTFLKKNHWEFENSNYFGVFKDTFQSTFPCPDGLKAMLKYISLMTPWLHDLSINEPLGRMDKASNSGLWVIDSGHLESQGELGKLSETLSKSENNNPGFVKEIVNRAYVWHM